MKLNRQECLFYCYSSVSRTFLSDPNVSFQLGNDIIIPNSLLVLCKNTLFKRYFYKLKIFLDSSLRVGIIIVFVI
jgi:hypothetical protein